jgi:hypothetical protein
MAHPELSNLSPFACEMLFVTNEEATCVCVPLVQARYALSRAGELELLEQQPPIELAGAWWGDPASSSMRLEPQIAFVKPATDIVLIGHAFPSNREKTEGLAGIRVGDTQKLARVFGKRRYVKRFGSVCATDPEPFEKIALTYENALGGWDRRDPDPHRHSFEPRNPVGMGYRDPKLPFDDEWTAPHLEDPERLYNGGSDRPPPVGFGFVAPDWQPRAGFAGTYDKAWSDTRKPQLPKDFDRRFFSAASSGLVAPGYLRGDEAVSVIGASPDGRAAFHLPGTPAPTVRLRLKSRDAVELATVLDTLVVDMDAGAVTLTWRAHLPVPRGVHDVAALELPPLAPEDFADEEE